MTPLRQRFVEDLQLRNYSPRTVEVYVSAVARFAAHFGRSPEQLGPEEIRAYQLHLIGTEHASWSRFNQTVCALRYLYGTTLGRPDVVTMIPYGRRPKTVRPVLSRAEVQRLLAALPDHPYRTMVRLTYACGLRAGEVLRLRVSDIDSQRMVLVIQRGKGQKDRLVPLAPLVLEELRAYWRRYRPRDWLFPGKGLAGHLDLTALQRFFHRLVLRLGFTKHVSLHTLRHSYATHLLEAGVDSITLQQLLGHSQLSTTARYLHVQAAQWQRLSGVLDDLLAGPAAVADPAPSAGPTPIRAAPSWVRPPVPRPSSHE